MSKLTEIERTLAKLEAVHSELAAGATYSESAEAAGYAAVHVARRATEDAFRDLHQKRDRAPDLKKSENIYGLTLKQAKIYLSSQDSAKTSPQKRALLAVAKLMKALRGSVNNFILAIQAKEVAVLLLGPHRLGGVYAEWQTSTLGVGLLTWQEQQKLNERILKMVEDLDPKQGRRDAKKYKLKSATWIEVGCYMNITKSCFQAIADQDLRGFREKEVLRIGSGALRTIEHIVASDPAQYQYEECNIADLEAMEAAVRESLMLGDAREFWNRLTHTKAVEIVRFIQSSEPYAKLREMVVHSARSAGVEV